MLQLIVATSTIQNPPENNGRGSTVYHQFITSRCHRKMP